MSYTSHGNHWVDEGLVSGRCGTRHQHAGTALKCAMNYNEVVAPYQDPPVGDRAIVLHVMDRSSFDPDIFRLPLTSRQICDC